MLSYGPGSVFNNRSLSYTPDLYLEASECNTTSDWLNHTIQPVRSCFTITFQFAKFGEKDKENLSHMHLTPFSHSMVQILYSTYTTGYTRHSSKQCRSRDVILEIRPSLVDFLYEFVLVHTFKEVRRFDIDANCSKGDN